VIGCKQTTFAEIFEDMTHGSGFAMLWCVVREVYIQIRVVTCAIISDLDLLDVRTVCYARQTDMPY
jgi:hypothetical protein